MENSETAEAFISAFSLRCAEAVISEMVYFLMSTQRAACKQQGAFLVFCSFAEACSLTCTSSRTVLGPAFWSLALLRFADEAIEDILKLEGSKDHSDAFYEFCKGFSEFCGGRRRSNHIAGWMNGF